MSRDDADMEQQAQERIESDDGSAVVNLTDFWNAQQLVQRADGKVCYSDVDGCWYVYDGTRFRRDETLEIHRLANAAIGDIYEMAATATADAERKKYGAWALKSESQRSKRAMIDAARALAPVHPDQFDESPMLFNVLNGTVDLESYELSDHSPANLLTKRAPVRFDADATCPKWIAFLNRIFDGDPDLIEYWKRIFGYCLTGHISVHALFILYGTGRNGKSTLLYILGTLGGDYATHAYAKNWTMNRSDPQNFMLAPLKGVRIVTATESGSGQRLDEALIKAMTGGDPITAAHKHGRPFVFQPVFKPFLATNSKPEIRGTDEGIWSRQRMIPFEVAIPESEQIPDPIMRADLGSELSGILNWALEGLREFNEIGLNDPEIVLAATRAYREEMDVLGEWMAVNCVVGADSKILFSDLFKDYQEFTTNSGGEPISKKAFSGSLTDRGMKSKRGAGNKTYVSGIAKKGSGSVASVTDSKYEVTDFTDDSRKTTYTPSREEIPETPVTSVTGNSHAEAGSDDYYELAHEPYPIDSVTGDQR